MKNNIKISGDSHSYWLTSSVSASKKFVEGKMSEEKYINDYVKTNVSGFNPMLLKYYPNTLLQVLKKLSLQKRRYFLFSGSGLTIPKLASSYGYGRNRIQKYLNVEQDKNDAEFIARLAIIHRIPPDWLEFEEPFGHWVTYHFHTVDKTPRSIEQLFNVIESEEGRGHQVNGYVVRTPSNSFIYVRIEKFIGSALVEVFNHNVVPSDLMWFISNLNKYESEYGNITSLIPVQNSFCIICYLRKAPFCLPIGFRPILNISTFLGTNAHIES